VSERNSFNGRTNTSEVVYINGVALYIYCACGRFEFVHWDQIWSVLEYGEVGRTMQRARKDQKSTGRPGD
jgi:hypothetical protein